MDALAQHTDIWFKVVGQCQGQPVSGFNIVYNIMHLVLLKHASDKIFLT